MKYVIVAIALYLGSTLSAAADTPPEILGGIDSANFQTLDNANDIRGESFTWNIHRPKTVLQAMRDISFFCNGGLNRCTGRQITYESSSLEAVMFVEYRVDTFRGGKFKIENRWKKY